MIFFGRIADRLDGRRPPPATDEGPGEPTFSYRDVFDDLGRDLESLRLKVVTAEDEYVRRQARSAAIGRQSEELAEELYDRQVAARRILGGAYDPDQGFELAAVSGTTPRNYKPLEEQVDQTVKLLREPVVEEPEVKLDGVDIDLGEVADGLEARMQGFRAKRSDLDRARKAVGESKVLLDRTLDEFKGSFPWIAQALEAFARMAGERELADRIRTSIRRVTRRQGENEEGSAEEKTSDETESSTETASSAEKESPTETESWTETASSSETESSAETASSDEIASASPNATVETSSAAVES